jgi:hypothetical protein
MKFLKSRQRLEQALPTESITSIPIKGVHEFSPNLGETAKFQAPEW